MGGILVTGGTGQVASALGRLGAARALPMRVVGRPQFDFADPPGIDRVFAETAPEIVLNAAAYTAVDKAETDQAAAQAANTTGPAHLAALCAAAGARLIHISTDYVFDGTAIHPYREDDPTGPTGVYGATKLAGEQAVLKALPSALILRTAWVYAPEGKNFLLTMLNAGRKMPQLRVVADQFGCPTLAEDLAAAMLSIVAGASWPAGVMHATGSGRTSWHGFATAIFAAAAPHGLPSPEVIPIATSDWPTPARRPANSVLDCSLLARTCGITLPPWQDSVARTVAAVLAAPAA